MGDFSNAAAAIRTQMETVWPTLQPTVRMLWGNERLEPVPDPLTDKDGWLAVEIRSGAENLKSFGGFQQNRWRQSGEVIIRIFVPIEVGESQVRTLAANACSVFRGWMTGDLKFFAASTTGGDTSEDGNWYELDCICSYFFDLIA